MAWQTAWIKADFCVSKLALDLNNSISKVISGSDDAANCINLGMHEDFNGNNFNNISNVSYANCTIDKSLVAAQTALSAVNAIDDSNNASISQQKTQLSWFLGAGTAGPAIIAGTMLIVYQFAIALFVGLGPLFILCLLWSKTAGLFSKWLFYGIATMFSNAMLAVVSSITLKLSAAITLSMFAANSSIASSAISFIGSLLGGGSGAHVPSIVMGGAGLMHATMVCGGIGLMVSTLIVVVPPMAGNFFSGALGGFNAYSYFAGNAVFGTMGSAHNPASGGNTGGGVAGANNNNNTKPTGSGHGTANKQLGDAGAANQTNNPDPTSANKSTQALSTQANNRHIPSEASAATSGAASQTPHDAKIANNAAAASAQTYSSGGTATANSSNAAARANSVSANSASTNSASANSVSANSASANTVNAAANNANQAASTPAPPAPMSLPPEANTTPEAGASSPSSKA